MSTQQRPIWLVEINYKEHKGDNGWWIVSFGNERDARQEVAQLRGRYASKGQVMRARLMDEPGQELLITCDADGCDEVGDYSTIRPSRAREQAAKFGGWSSGAGGDLCRRHTAVSAGSPGGET